MLKTLTVDNFALIDHLQIEFSSGLNILTGETGAGKSILIDALGAILGERASVDSIRRDCEFFRVEAVVDIYGRQALADLLEEMAIPVEEDTLIISRRLTKSGKNTVTVNGCQTPLALLRQIGELLVDMHGQHDNQALLRPQAYLAMVDHFDVEVEQELTCYQSVYHQWQQVSAELEKMEMRSRERERRIEMLTWQCDEIARASLRVGEDEQAEQEVRLLANIEKVSHAVTHSYVLLKQGERGQAIVSALGEIRRELDSIVRFDESLKAQVETVAECLYQLEDTADELHRYLDGIDFDPHRLQKLEERLDTIHTLKKKYGATIADILAYQQEAAAELDGLQNAGQTAEKLAAKQQQLGQELTLHAEKLDQERRQVASQLELAVTQHLRELGMPNAVFHIDVQTVERFLPTGQNEVSCLFSANRGEDPKPLQKVASGGELSRIALAIKSVNAYRDIVGTIIFDEVDAGIGGITAQRVAEKIAFVAQGKQVLCITHSPPIASMADVHFIVEKSVNRDRTLTLIRQLTPSERIVELARMVAGDSTSQIAVDNARQMIETSKVKKEKWTNRA